MYLFTLENAHKVNVILLLNCFYLKLALMVILYVLVYDQELA